MFEQPSLQPTPRRALCLTIGDPTGIGPEIAAMFLARWAQGEFGSLADYKTKQPAANIIIFGDIGHLQKTADKLGLPLPGLAPKNKQRQASTAWVEYQEMNPSQAARPGEIAYNSIQAAVLLIKEGKADALVTGPISKENLKRADIPFEGHTEMLQALAREHYGGEPQSDMLFLYKQFRMLLLTRHVPLQLVSSTLTVPGVTQSLDSLCQFLIHTAGIEKPHLCMLGINPHAGELTSYQPPPGGKDNTRDTGSSASVAGSEEKNILGPAIATISKHYPVKIPAPVAADAAFRGFDCDNPSADAYVAAYHDQGLIPFKMAAGLEAVNVTIGLPFLRTSVSHGTAPDIAGQGIATPVSLIAAYNAALNLLKTSGIKPN